MKRKALYILKMTVVGLLALQVLNLSVCNQAYQDSDYDYSYAYNTSYDPTETAVEWLVELKCGQQQAFTYSSRTDTSKNNPLKVLHWQIGLEEIRVPAFRSPENNKSHFAKPAGRILSQVRDILSPPPDLSNG